MTAFVVRRIFSAIPTLLLASVVVFFITQFAPGDFLSGARALTMQPEVLANLRKIFGLDQPFYIQYFYWMRNLLQGDFGISFTYRAPVLDIILPRILNSLYLVLLATVFLYVVAVPVGVYGAVNQYSLGDKIISSLSYFFLGFPSFFLALIVLYIILQINFATGWNIPLIGMTSPGFVDMSFWEKVGDILSHIAIPALVLVLGDIALTGRILRGQMLEYLGADYTRTARAKGLKEFTVVYKHTLRNAIIPFVATIGGLLPALFTGAGFVEVVFAYPGITPMLISAITQQDILIVSGFLMLSAVLLILGNLLSDILLAVVDPRIQYS